MSNDLLSHVDVIGYPDVQTPPAPGEESAGPSLTPLVREVARTNDALHNLYLRTSRLWHPLRAYGAGVTATPSVLTLEPLQLGWEAEVERITLSVGGASAGATVAVYRGPSSAANFTPNEQWLVDFTNGLLGNSPSRQVSEYQPPIRLIGNDQLTFVITGAVVSQQFYVRLEGRKREL